MLKDDSWGKQYTQPTNAMNCISDLDVSIRIFGQKIKKISLKSFFSNYV